MDKMPVERATRAIRLLDDRCFELRSSIRDQLTSIWRNLIHWEEGAKKSLTISATIEGEQTSLGEAITSWKAFRELDTIASQLWHNLDELVLKPRTDIKNRSLSSISILQASFIVDMMTL